MSLNSTTVATAASPTGNFFPLEVAELRLDTPDSLLVAFAVPEALKSRFSFEPGQHLILRAYINGTEVRRPYSICSAVQDDALRIAIKRAPGGLFSNWAFTHLKPGVIVEVMPPSGRFGVPLSATQRHNYVAFAAGSGITPIFSIIKSTLIAEPESRFTLFYGNRSTSSVMLRNELGDLKDRFVNRFSLVHILTRERQESDLLCGRIDYPKCRDLLKRLVSAGNIDNAFICGPDSMRAEVKAALRSEGLPDAKIRIELFAAPKNGAQIEQVAAPDQQCAVTIILDAIEHRFTMPRDAESILKAGLRHGLDLRYGCQGGVCSSCRAHLRVGQVEMHAHYGLEDYEIDRGFILTCQSYPRTDELVVDFDRIH
ncbi:MAG: 2Fe-2S iron-sulfur cluster binding domain-containing protein [Verrucomicrobia bacterium]|nr:2Fe-2S iron-sulfur cluster binding domain-containing protein [Verrucomicrobiota bacterium]